MFHYCSCLISVLVSLQNYFSLFVVLGLPEMLVVTLCGQLIPFQWNEGTNEPFVVTLTVKKKINENLLSLEQNFVACLSFRF